MTTNEPVIKVERQRSSKTLILVLLAGAVALGFGIRSGIVARVNMRTALAASAEKETAPIVSVTHPKSGAAADELTLPGNTQAFSDTPIYARTSGYLKRWYYDLGAHVTRGALLAEIETPEIDKQLEQARADLQVAQANYHLAETTATRWQFLLRTNAVSKQETDEKIGDLSAKKASLESALSNVRRLEDLQSFQKVYAPFDGVITARKTDVGALIDAGAGTPARELFHMAAIQQLRVYVAVPEVYAAAAKPGATASLTADEYPDRMFWGTLVRTSSAIDPAAHTLLTEVDVNNPDGALLPGAYVSVHLKLPGRKGSVTVPSNALLFRSEGLRAGTVKDGRAELAPVKVGRDYGAEVEILSGLRPSDTVILDPPDSLVSGMPVRVASGTGAEAAK